MRSEGWLGYLGVFVLLVAACGGSRLSLTEYSEEAERLVAQVGNRIDDLDNERSSRPPSVAGEQHYWDGRVAARVEFREGFRSLEPPDAVAALHNAAVDVISRLTEAVERVAARAALMERTADIDKLWQSTEVEAWRAVDDESVEICHAAQAEVDATEERAVFEGNLWIPPELKEVVRVTFGCTAEQR